VRANVPLYELKEPKNLSEVLRLLKNEPDTWRPFAGGTDLMVVFETGQLQHLKYLSLWNLKELRGIKEGKKELKLGALTTYSQVRENKIIKKYFPLLAAAAKETGAVAIQNRGTLGGNIANASPAADSPPALLVYDASLEITSIDGVRLVPYSKFHLGYKKTDLKNSELITRIHLPFYKQKLRHFYRKVGTRRAQAISKICFAGVLRMEKGRIHHLRLALGSVAPVPLRCLETESFLLNQKITPALVAKAKEILRKEITPIDDIRSTAQYRGVVTGNLLEEFLCGTGSVS
jgi:CO/xanthine dehydrogenase FAD-binding subunit